MNGPHVAIKACLIIITLLSHSCYLLSLHTALTVTEKKIAIFMPASNNLHDNQCLVCQK